MKILAARAESCVSTTKVFGFLVQVTEFLGKCLDILGFENLKSSNLFVRLLLE
jgi:hypothetical protein